MGHSDGEDLSVIGREGRARCLRDRLAAVVANAGFAMLVMMNAPGLFRTHAP